MLPTQGAARAQRLSSKYCTLTALLLLLLLLLQKGSYTGGLLCLLPQHGMLFTPLDLEADLEAQLPFQARHGP